MQNFFHNQDIAREEAFIYTLTNETTNEKRYLVVKKMIDGRILIDDVTLQETEKRKERAIPLVEAINILQQMQVELSKNNNFKPEYR